MENNKTGQSGFGIAGMVIGIIAVLLSCVLIGGFFGFFGFILSIIGVCGKEKGKGTAIAGITLNAISIVIALTFLMAPSSDDTLSTSKNEPNGTETTEDTLKPQSKTESENAFSDDIIDVDISDCHITYLKHEIVENMSGKKCVAVYYEFTNNSNEGKTFWTTISDKAFQNGIELDTSTFHVNEESKNKDAEIKPGVTITVCSGFVLRDESADVELEIKKWITLKDEPDDKMVLSLR